MCSPGKSRSVLVLRLGSNPPLPRVHTLAPRVVGVGPADYRGGMDAQPTAIRARDIGPSGICPRGEHDWQPSSPGSARHLCTKCNSMMMRNYEPEPSSD